MFRSLLKNISVVIALCSTLAQAQQPLVLQIEIDAQIGSVTASYLKDAIRTAQEKSAEALLIVLNTPGGLMEATRQMVQDMLASPVPIIVYVSPDGARAGSAGVFLTIAAHVAVMAPTTHIGAAHPVNLFGSNIEGDMKKKIENDAAAWARSIAQTRGRNTKWAESAVIESSSLSALEALDKNVIDFIAEDVAHLLSSTDKKTITIGSEPQTLNLQDPKIEAYEMTGKQKLVSWLSNPNLLYLLMLLGMLGLFIEFQMPGVILPGLLGAICLSIVFGVQVLPINWLAVVLILGTMALFIAEVFITSLGLLALGGVTLLVIGSYLLFDVPGSPFYVSPFLIWAVAIFIGLLFLLFGVLIVRAKQQGPTSGIEATVGQRAIVYELISPEKSGTVRLQGSFWMAHAKELIEPDEDVIIERVDGTQLYVRKANK